MDPNESDKDGKEEGGRWSRQMMMECDEKKVKWRGCEERGKDDEKKKEKGRKKEKEKKKR